MTDSRILINLTSPEKPAPRHGAARRLACIATTAPRLKVQPVSRTATQSPASHSYTRGLSGRFTQSFGCETKAK